MTKRALEVQAKKLERDKLQFQKLVKKRGLKLNLRNKKGVKLRKIFITLFFIGICLFAYADEIYVDGHSYDEYDILGWAGIGAPSVSPAGKARTYFDSTANKLKIPRTAGIF